MQTEFLHAYFTCIWDFTAVIRLKGCELSCKYIAVFNGMIYALNQKHDECFTSRKKFNVRFTSRK